MDTHAHGRRAAAANRGRDTRFLGAGPRPAGRGRPLSGADHLAGVRGHEPHSAAPPRLRRVRRRGRWPHTRTVDHNEDFPMSETNPIRDAIQEAIDEHAVILFMKGTPEQPACGFSARTVAALQALGTPFAAVDILPDPRIREELSAISSWPTIPQLFVGGDLVGGCDIVTEMYENGELAQTLGVEQPEDAAPEAE